MYARAPSRGTLLLPRMRSRRFFFCTISFQASTPNFLWWEISRSCSLPRVGYAIVANRDSWQDLRFLRDAREIRKTATIGLCACLSSVIVQSFARRRASRAEEIGFARGCSHVHFCTCFLSRVRFLLVFFELRTCILPSYESYITHTNCKNVRKYERRYRGLLHCTLGLHVLVP